MIPRISLLLAMLLADAAAAFAQTNFAVLTREHTDLRLLYAPSASNQLEFVARNEDQGVNCPSNQVILVAGESSRLTLPAGTPFGDVGAPFWILPQSQNVNLLYLGVSAEGIPAGVFNGPLSIALKRLKGPGYFMVWQATGPGQFNIRVNTRDGLGAADAFTPIIGSHEHFNWGFSSTGVFSATFQVTGQRIGEATNISSPETTFLFHVQPLPPPTNYATWAGSHWPPGFNPPTTLPEGNPDGDAFDNLHEYAFGLSPTNANPVTDSPHFSLATEGGQLYGTLAFRRYLPARDVLLGPQVTGTLTNGWLPLTNFIASEPGATSTVERVVVRDRQPAVGNPHRFYRLQPILH